MKAFGMLRETAAIRSFRSTSGRPFRAFTRISKTRKNTQSAPHQRTSILRDILRQPISHTARQTQKRTLHETSRKLSAYPTPDLGSPKPSLSLYQRLRKLSREYGWSAFGVYMLLTALDFPFCFLAVRWLGTDRIGHWEHIIVQYFWKIVPWPFPEHTAQTPAEAYEVPQDVQQGNHQAVEETGWGVKEAEKANRSDQASIWTQLALAYAIHKSFIFVRVPLTAAVTPKVVKVLRGWGWDIGKRKPKGLAGTKS
ncbi:MAG: hypothetical protein M1835_004184 [Candelina submexicana]|nr:MAG: hypothetical protein M1835_004184 [Candelina submexicana]